MLMAVLAWQGFPEHVRKFFTSYLVGRGMRYLWNLFSSDRRSADMGVGQGSALSPVLSALYLAPVIKLFEFQAAHLECNVLSYIDDGTLIVQAKEWGSNLDHLHQAYGIVFNLFECFGLVLQHDKSKLFHFTCKHGDTNPPLAFGWGLFTKETPLKPKEHWRYLGFFFDQHLLFHEHVHLYATKAISMVHTMGMLGNSFHRLSPWQKHILYRSCVIPIATYGFKLWYYSGACRKGQVATLAKMQHHTALWITGAFCTSSVSGVGALAGLIPINLHLQKLAAQSSYQIATLSPTHPLAALAHRPGSKRVPQHWHSIARLDYNTCLCCAAGRVTAPDAELYAIWIGLGLAMAVPGAKSIKLFTDHFAVARKAVDLSIHAGQGHSLEVCCMLADWLGADPEQSVTFIKVLSCLEWGFHKDVHDYVTDLNSQVSMGRHPYTSIDYARKHATDACQDEWVCLFDSHPLYADRGFLHLNDS
jgi:hypothetical protein